MMQSDQGFQSHLFKSMHSYLSNPNRVQPIIGLSSVIELCTGTKPPVYLCEVCVLRVNITDIKTHIMGSLHRYNYIKSCHTYELGADTDLAPQAWHLLKLAKLIEKKEGTGNVQVLHLHEDIYKEMISQPVLDVLSQVKQIIKQPNTTAQSPARTAIQVRPPSPRGYSLLNCISNISPATASSSVPAAGAFQRGNPIGIGDSTQNVTLHEDKTVKSWGNAINTFKCLSTESPLSTVQITKLKYKRVVQCQNNSLTVTITQKPIPEHIKGQESIQDHLTTLNPMSTGAHTQAIIWNEDQWQINDYLTSEEPFRDTDWVPHNRKVGHEDLQHPQPFTADDTLFMYESTGQYEQLQDHSEEYIVPLPKHCEDFPENYSGTQPLIGQHAVIKCQSVAGDPPPCCYLCQPCSLKVLKSDIIHHLISPLHQISYINFQYPHLSQCHSAIQNLETTAMQLDQQEGRGQMEVRRLSACLFNEVLEQDFHLSMKMLNCGSIDERSLNQTALRKRSRMTPDDNIPLTRSAVFTGMTVDCDENGATGKTPFSRKKAI
ncbi:hypothetical protein AMELA_G00249190 [Ameiurus melas]|uniref:Uncharacterized protein n=1 Tax=Ameiurus melas TaxID=219545 RepID=A0A7J5ZTV7_AMEME|nr:hypothetical protein AMELA_G00249190 [Ameiurus melas]